MPLSVIDPVSSALQRTGLVLFRPFRFQKWMAISLGAWLWLMGEGGVSFPNFSGSSGGGGGRGGGPGPPLDVARKIQNAWDWVVGNLYWLIPVALVVLLVGTAVYLVWRWLSSRGTFMFFDNIVNNDTRVKAPWADFKAQGNSLFKFRIGWDLIWFNAWLVLLIIVGFLVWKDFVAFVVNDRYVATGWTISAAVALALGGLLIAVAHWILSSVVFRLAVPVMYIRRMNAWPAVRLAWREMFLPNKGACLLYFLFLIVVGMVRGIWGMTAMIVLALVTCCVGLLMASIPFAGIYIVALASLPALTFDRAYTLYFVAQFGPDYNVAWQVPAFGGFPVIMDNVPPETPGM